MTSVDFAVPRIDLARPDVAARLLDAFSNLGFATIVNHGVDRDLLAQVFDASRRFHALPTEAKAAIALDANHRGWIAPETSTDRTSELATVDTPNRSSSFMMMGEAGADHPDVTGGVYLAGPNQWPDLDRFRPVLEAYHHTLSGLCHRLIGLFAHALGHQPQALVDHFDPPTTWLRLLQYPPARQPPARQPPAKGSGAEVVFGAAPHIDFGAITVLAQDQVGGLEVQHPDGGWLGVIPDEDAFVLNTGTMMRCWSGGRLRATPHRVINRSSEERYSVPFFYDPHMTTLVEPLDGPHPDFTPTVFGDFVRSQLTATYDQHPPQGS